MFGRSKLLMKVRAPSSCSRITMSARVCASAVAVSAMRGTPAKRSCSTLRPRYSSRKSWPHWLTQCASSMANRLSSWRSCSESSMRQEARRQDALGRRVQQHQPARAQLALDRPTRPGCRACEFRKLACTPSFFERADLVVHQRDQRRHHHRHAAPGAVAGDRRHLVAQALAAAGGHQHQRVAAADHMLDDRLPGRRGRPA